MQYSIALFIFFPNKNIFISLYHSYNSFGHIVNFRWEKSTYLTTTLDFQTMCRHMSKLTVPNYSRVSETYGLTTIKYPALLLYTIYHFNKCAYGMAAITFDGGHFGFILFYQRVTDSSTPIWILLLGLSNMNIKKKLHRTKQSLPYVLIIIANCKYKKSEYFIYLPIILDF